MAQHRQATRRRSGEKQSEAMETHCHALSRNGKDTSGEARVQFCNGARWKSVAEKRSGKALHGKAAQRTSFEVMCKGKARPSGAAEKRCDSVNGEGKAMPSDEMVWYGTDSHKKAPTLRSNAGWAR